MYLIYNFYFILENKILMKKGCVCVNKISLIDQEILNA